ncbi:hypothetical protein ANN_17206 [Periplaneta americana]|uniref:Uncharacterized protein n=1 Tax=Periplaneta americana TaxID=6978 RepID=A0ABQ8STK5_PERAM|nr:hypothetical protein ANN_17206 [Periplaneta americana]
MANRRDMRQRVIALVEAGYGARSAGRLVGVPGSTAARKVNSESSSPPTPPPSPPPVNTTTNQPLVYLSYQIYSLIRQQIFAIGLFGHIEQRFFPSSHSFLQCDSDFSLIEKRQKVTKALIPSDLLKIVQDSKVVKPFQTVSMLESYFLNMQDVADQLISIKNLNISKTCCIQCDVSKAGVLLPPYITTSLNICGISGLKMVLKEYHVAPSHVAANEPDLIELLKAGNGECKVVGLKSIDNGKRVFRIVEHVFTMDGDDIIAIIPDPAVKSSGHIHVMECLS